MRELLFDAIKIVVVSFLLLFALDLYITVKRVDDPLYDYKPRICDYFDDETAEKIRIHFNKKALYLKDSLGRIPTMEEFNSFRMEEVP